MCLEQVLIGSVHFRVPRRSRVTYLGDLEAETGTLCVPAVRFIGMQRYIWASVGQPSCSFLIRKRRPYTISKDGSREGMGSASVQPGGTLTNGVTINCWRWLSPGGHHCVGLELGTLGLLGGTSFFCHAYILTFFFFF